MSLGLKKRMHKKKLSCDVYVELGMIERGTTDVEHEMDCPKCGKDRFSINIPKGTHNCLHGCGLSGNNAQIGAQMEKTFKEALTINIRQRVAEMREVPHAVFLGENAAEMGYNQLNDKITWTVKDCTGKVVGTKQRKIAKTSNLVKTLTLSLSKQHMMGVYELDDSVETVYICEGEWDYHCVKHIIKELDLEEECGAVCSPGNEIVNIEGGKPFEGKGVIYLGHNDAASIRGAHKFKARYGRECEYIKFLNWDLDGVKKGYDVQDLFCELNCQAVDTMDVLSWMVCAEPQSTVCGIPLTEEEKKHIEQPKERPVYAAITYQELVDVYRSNYHATNNDILDVILMTMWSRFLPGKPLMMYVVAPSSGGKSEILSTLRTIDDDVRYETDLSKPGMVSGAILGGGLPSPGLISRMDKKPNSIIVIPDITPLLQSPERDGVFGILRDTVDGVVHKNYGNGVVLDHDEIHYTVLAGVTPEIDSYSVVAMGERFLKFRSDKAANRQADFSKGVKAVMNSSHEVETKENLKRAILGYFANEINIDRLMVPVSHGFAYYIASLAMIVVKSRGVFTVDENGVNRVVPAHETPARVSNQLVKVARASMQMYHCESLEEVKIKNMLARVAMDTVDPITLEMVRIFFDAGNMGIEVYSGNITVYRGVSRFLPGEEQDFAGIYAASSFFEGYSNETIKRMIPRMIVMNIITKIKGGTFRLSIEFKKYLSETGIFSIAEEREHNEEYEAIYEEQ